MRFEQKTGGAVADIFHLELPISSNSEGSGHVTPVQPVRVLSFPWCTDGERKALEGVMEI